MGMIQDDSFTKQKSHVFFSRDDSNHEVMLSDGTAGRGDELSH